MHGLGILPEHALRVALGIAGLGRAFRPAIAVRMQRDVFDAEPITALAKLSGAVRFANGNKIREERPRARTAQNHLPRLRPDAHAAEIAGFFSRVGKGVALIINVLSVQMCDVGLGAAEMPAQLVKIAALIVMGMIAVSRTLVASCRDVLGGDNPLMFFGRDAALLLVFDFWKFFLRQYGHRQ